MKGKLLLFSLFVAACTRPPAGTAGALSGDTTGRGSALRADPTHDTMGPAQRAGSTHDTMGPAQRAGPRPDTRPTIVFLGTSLTAGLGLDPADAYPALIQRRLDSLGIALRVVNAGVSGETSAGALRRIDWVLNGPVALFVIETGANDGLRGQDPDSTAANIEAIIARARAHHPAPIVALMQMRSLPNYGANYRRRFDGLYPALAKRDGVPLVPFLLSGVAGIDTLNQNDGVHPNVKGERIVADNVWRRLEPVIRQIAEPGKSDRARGT